MTTVIVISSFFVPRPSLGGIDQNLDMLTTDFYTLPVTELDEDLTDPLPQEYIREDVTVDELLYYLYVLEFKGMGVYGAESDAIINSLIVWLPETYGFRYSLGEPNVREILEQRPTSLGVDSDDAEVLVSRMKVTGIEPVDGFAQPELSEVTIWR